MKRATSAVLAVAMVLAAGIALPGCGGKTVCGEACAKADDCLSQLGIPIQDIYNTCVVPCSYQNIAWKTCVLGCDTDKNCPEYALCLLYCGYWQ
jgi:hypothetical protein